MFINVLLSKIQRILKPVYDRSFILQNIDLFIGINIFFVIFSSLAAQSDFIGYFALFSIILTAIKLLVKENSKLEPNIAEKFLLVYFMLVIISVAGSSLFSLSLKGFFKTAVYIGFYISLTQYFKDNKQNIKYIFLSFIICSCYETFVAYLQNFFAVEEISGWQDMSHLNPEEVMTRVYGTLKPYNPNLFGGYMLSIIPAFIALPCCFNKPSFINNYVYKTLIFISITCCLLSVSALLLTGCRGAYIGLFFEILILAAFTYKLIKPVYKRFFTVISAFLASVVSLIIISIASLRARIFSIFAMRSDSSNSFRFNVYHSSIQMFKDNWLLGIGCGNQNFREIYGLYMKTGFDALSAYNIYLEIAVESGIFALISFICFLVINIFSAIKFILKCGTEEKFCVLACIISVAGILTHGIVDTVFFRPQIQFVFWIMTAVIKVITTDKMYKEI